MKQIIFIGSFLFFAGASAFCQDELAFNSPTSSTTTIHRKSKSDKEEDKFIKKEKALTTPNYLTEQQFLIDFPNATAVEWYNKEMPAATFMMNGKKMTAFYDYKNELIGTTTMVPYSDVPEAGQKYIDKHYKDFTVERVVLFDDNENNETDMMLYGTPFDDEDNYFVELSNNNKEIVLQVNTSGDVSFFKEMK